MQREHVMSQKAKTPKQTTVDRSASRAVEHPHAVADLSALPAHPVLQLHEAIGNRALAGLIQAKLAGPGQRRPDAGDSENGADMPGPLKAGLEALSGMDLSGVRVHTNSSKPAQLNALAYTQGQDIHVAPGQERHLPHEGWHTVQQMQGRVRPTMQAKGVSINDDAGLEREAEAMGVRALQIKGAEQAMTGFGQEVSKSLPQNVETKGKSDVPSEANEPVQLKPKSKQYFDEVGSAVAKSDSGQAKTMFAQALELLVEMQTTVNTLIDADADFQERQKTTEEAFKALEKSKEKSPAEHIFELITLCVSLYSGIAGLVSATKLMNSRMQAIRAAKNELAATKGAVGVVPGLGASDVKNAAETVKSAKTGMALAGFAGGMGAKAAGESVASIPSKVASTKGGPPTEAVDRAMAMNIEALNNQIVKIEKKDFTFKFLLIKHRYESAANFIAGCAAQLEIAERQGLPMQDSYGGDIADNLSKAESLALMVVGKTKDLQFLWRAYLWGGPKALKSGTHGRGMVDKLLEWRNDPQKRHRLFDLSVNIEQEVKIVKFSGETTRAWIAPREYASADVVKTKELPGTKYEVEVAAQHVASYLGLTGGVTDAESGKKKYKVTPEEAWALLAIVGGASTPSEVHFYLKGIHYEKYDITMDKKNRYYDDWHYHQTAGHFVRDVLRHKTSGWSDREQPLFGRVEYHKYGWAESYKRHPLGLRRHGRFVVE